MKKIKRALGDGATCCGGQPDCDLECSGREKREAAKEAKAAEAAKEETK